MRHLLAAILLTSCSALGIGSGEPVDLVAIADKVELYRADVMDVVYPLAEPDAQAQILRLSDATKKVETALRAAGAGGPLSDWQTAAGAALTVADSVILELKASGKDTGNAQAIVGLAKVILRHLAAGDVSGAAKL